MFVSRICCIMAVATGVTRTCVLEAPKDLLILRRGFENFWMASLCKVSFNSSSYLSLPDLYRVGEPFRC